MFGRGARIMALELRLSSHETQCREREEATAKHIDIEFKKADEGRARVFAKIENISQDLAAHRREMDERTMKIMRSVIAGLLAVFFAVASYVATQLVGVWQRSDNPPQKRERTIMDLADKPADGIDVSFHQGDAGNRKPLIDWGRVAAAGLRFAIVKATEGIEYQDPQFARNWRETKAADLVRGAYHYLRFDRPGDEQAKNFLATVEFAAGDMRPVVDIEDLRHGVPNVLTAAAFIDTVERALQQRVIVYTYPSFWPRLGSPDNWADRDLWIAHYNIATPSMPRPWTDYAIHQYSADGKIPGIVGDVDLNRLNCNLDYLRIAA